MQFTVTLSFVAYCKVLRKWFVLDLPRFGTCTKKRQVSNNALSQWTFPIVGEATGVVVCRFAEYRLQRLASAPKLAVQVKWYDS